MLFLILLSLNPESSSGSDGAGGGLAEGEDETKNVRALTTNSSFLSRTEFGCTRIAVVRYPECEHRKRTRSQLTSITINRLKDGTGHVSQLALRTF